MLGALLAGYLMGGWLIAGAAAASILAGVVLFPIFLPYLPTREFSFKGYILGVSGNDSVSFIEIEFCPEHHLAGRY